MNERLLTTQEVADILQVDVSTVRMLIREGRLAAVQFGKREYRIRRDELDRFIRENEKRGTDS